MQHNNMQQDIETDDTDNPPVPLCPEDKCSSPKEAYNCDCIRNADSQTGVTREAIGQGEDSVQDDLVSPNKEGLVLNKTKKRRRPKHKKKSKGKGKGTANASKDESDSGTEVAEDNDRSLSGLGISYPFDGKFQLRHSYFR
jgi:hypothetical protein